MVAHEWRLLSELSVSRQQLSYCRCNTLRSNERNGQQVQMQPERYAMQLASSKVSIFVLIQATPRNLTLIGCGLHLRYSCRSILLFQTPKRLVAYDFLNRARQRQPPHYQIVHTARQARAVAGGITNATNRWKERIPETTSAYIVLLYSFMRSTSKLSTE